MKFHEVGSGLRLDRLTVGKRVGIAVNCRTQNWKIPPLDHIQTTSLKIQDIYLTESHRVGAHGTKRPWRTSDRQSYLVVAKGIRTALANRAAPIQRFSWAAGRQGRVGRTWNV